MNFREISPLPVQSPAPPIVPVFLDGRGLDRVPVPGTEAWEFTDAERLGDVAVQVHIGWWEGGIEPFVAAVVVRVLGHLDPSREVGTLNFVEGTPHLSWRDASRLPIGTVVRAALSLAASRRAQGDTVQAEGGSLPMFDPNVIQEIAESLPQGKPQRGKGSAFYMGIAKAYTKYETLGLSPPSEIAKAKGVPAGTARQWVLSARRMGLLPPAKKGNPG